MWIILRIAGLWLWRIVLLLGLRLRLVSTYRRLMRFFLLDRRIDCLFLYQYTAAFICKVLFILYSKKGNIILSLLYIYKDINLKEIL